MLSLRLIAAVFAFGLLSIGGPQAAVLINAFEDSGNVKFVGSGSLNLSGLTLLAEGITNAFDGEITPNSPDLRFSLSNIDVYGYITVPGPLGFGANVSGASVFGSSFGFDNLGFNSLGRLAVPHQYVSGSPLSFSMTFELATFVSLGMFNPRTSIFELPNDTITLVVGAEPNPVPLPAALPLFASALIGGGVVAWRKRRKQKTEPHTA